MLPRLLAAFAAIILLISPAFAKHHYRHHHRHHAAHKVHVVKRHPLKKISPPYFDRAHNNAIGAMYAVIPDETAHIAVYSIAEHVIRLPDGMVLEAHSGLGKHQDKVTDAVLRNRGPTPPNEYRLVMRANSFHGVRAIRLVPLDEKKMHGRDGMLVHSYLHGRAGQSHGCAAVRQYKAFLRAFLRGEIDRLIVVPTTMKSV